MKNNVDRKLRQQPYCLNDKRRNDVIDVVFGVNGLVATNSITEFDLMVRFLNLIQLVLLLNG